MTTAPLTRRGELADLRAVVGRLDLECTVVTTPQCRQRLLNLRACTGNGVGAENSIRGGQAAW